MTMVQSRDRVEEFFTKDVAAFTSALDDLQLSLDASAPPSDDSAFRYLLEKLDQIRSACRDLEMHLGEDERLLREVQQRYQQAIDPWLRQSWMMHHAKSKPRGYAGDYEMLLAIYDGVPRSTGLGGYFDRFFLQTELGRAVPARMDAVRNFLIYELSGRPAGTRVLNVACGPCQEFMRPLPLREDQEVEVLLVDFDSDALKHSERTVVPVQSPQMKFGFTRYNALRMQVPKRFKEQFGMFDLIYSVGLCDYLSDRQLIGMFRGWKQLLREGGATYVAFKDMNRYDKTDYQWLVDWFFLSRDEEDCRNLFIEAGWQSEEIEMQRDATGIIMDFVVRTDTRVHTRVDPSHALTGGATPVLHAPRAAVTPSMRES